jgi:hypothetical protein
VFAGYFYANLQNSIHAKIYANIIWCLIFLHSMLEQKCKWKRQFFLFFAAFAYLPIHAITWCWSWVRCGFPLTKLLVHRMQLYDEPKKESDPSASSFQLLVSEKGFHKKQITSSNPLASLYLRTQYTAHSVYKNCRHVGTSKLSRNKSFCSYIKARHY